jgi:carbohydrate diacid regulator
MLNQKLAQELVEKASAISGCNTHITNTEGIIIGASDRTRIGQFHEATSNIIKQRRYCEYTAEEAAKIRGTRAGSGSPIFFRENILGVVSISGEPNEIRKYGELVRNQVEMMCEQAFQYEFMQLEHRAKEAFVQETDRKFNRMRPSMARDG